MTTLNFGGGRPDQVVGPKFPPKLKFLFKSAPYKVVYGGRGGAKSWGMARALLLKGMEEKLLILCAREFQNSIEESVHRLLSTQIEAMGLEKFYEIQDKRIIGKNGTEIVFKGLKVNISSLKSFEAVDIVWVEEAQTVSKHSWEVLIPTIRRKGSEIWVSFNPALEDDDTYQRFVVNPPPGTIVEKMNYSDNPFFDDDGGVLRAKMEHARNSDPDGFLNIWEGHCRQTLEGAVYAKELREMTANGRVTNVPYDPIKPVNTFWDLGFSDATSIWFAQRIGFEIRLIDFLEVRQTTVNDILAQLQTKGYIYDHDYLPHDAQAKTLASNGKSIEQLLRGLGRRVKIVPNISITDGINAARTIFPMCWFDRTRCADGIQSLRHYRFDVDEHGKFSRKPLHDESSHAADAFRYFAVATKDPAMASVGPKLKPAREPYVYAGGGGFNDTQAWMQ